MATAQQPFPYHPDTPQVFAALAARPWAAFLDSNREGGDRGRYDILTADPGTTLVTRGGVTEVRTAQGTLRSRRDPFALAADALNTQPALQSHLPFVTGAIGWFGYELGRPLAGLAPLATDLMPEMAIGIYDWALVVDHTRRESWLTGPGAAPWRSALLAALDQAPLARTAALRAKGPVRCSLGRKDYAHAFARIQAYLQAGDCYQINLTRRFELAVSGDPWAGYLELRRINPAPFGAYLNTPFGQILSCSPERFLEARDGVVETRPIKGTRPRSADPYKDRRLAEELGTHPKDRAENLMIVDLLRNDLGRVCLPGSIQAKPLFEVESFASVHQLVSTIRGRLRPGEDALSLLRGAFPGGSITGAPKRRAMQIIDELEPCPRGVYCGAIGYLDAGGGMDTSIAIRTLVHRDGQASFAAGGGIVADSTLEGEFQETLDKADALFRFLGVSREEASGL